MLGSTPENMDNLEKLAEMGVRLALAGHTPFQASVKVIHEIMLHLKQGGSSRELQDKIATSDLMGIATGEQHYTSLQKDFLEWYKVSKLHFVNIESYIRAFQSLSAKS